jgi:hypothetical protein
VTDSASSSVRRSEILLARGARSAEACLIQQALSRARKLANSGRFDRSVEIVVPSRSLREHVLAQLAAQGGGLLGVRCSTHRGLALRVLENSGVDASEGLDAFAILARRFARLEESLALALDNLMEGYGGLLGSVRDLLDAGFSTAHLRAIEEALETEGPTAASADELERAQALTRITARVLAAFDELGVGRSSILLQQATDLISHQPQTALAADSVLLHGFADATGVTSDFLTALLRSYGGCVVFDRPPDPIDAEREDPSASFTQRLEEHFRGVAEPRQEVTDVPPPQIALFRALGRHGEMREVAQRVRDLLDAGIEPESIGIVARDPTHFRSVLRSELARVAVPFSGSGIEGPSTPAGRRLRAAQELFAQGERCHVERWLDCLRHPDGAPLLFDVRVALAALGMSHVGQLVDLDLDGLIRNGYYSLPVRQGFYETEEDSDKDPEVRTQQRRVPGADLEHLIHSSRELCGHFSEWRSQPRSLEEHAGFLERTADLLEWPARSDERRHLESVLDALRLAPALVVEHDELVLVLRRQLAESGKDDFGGRGGGVQVMDVLDARGRTFEHLFVLGLNRGVFPRTIREDPVLPDRLRRMLSLEGHGVLPDLPVKRRGYEEERYLFAHLLSSSPNITLSWLEVDDSDRAVPPSPLIERLRWTHPDRHESWRSPQIVGRDPLVELGPDRLPLPNRLERLPFEDHAVLAGLHSREQRFSEVLPEVLRQLEPGNESTEADSLAATRLAILEELDPTHADQGRSCLTPYLGYIGEPGAHADPRANRKLYVTTIERMAICPWQTFIERLLRIESVPDPLEALPSINGLLIGILSHRVLEALVPDPGADTLDGLRGVLPSSVVWPAQAELDRILEREARATVKQAGIALDGFSFALAAVVRPYLDLARDLDWPGGKAAGLLAAEIEGSYEFNDLRGAPRNLAFRVDRVDRTETGLTLTDYKSGTSTLTQKTPGGRLRAYIREVSKGARLQAMVYALAAGKAGDVGRFTFLRPNFDAPDEARLVEARITDEALVVAFERAVRTSLDAWDLGLFFPRMEPPGKAHDKPRACEWCRVAEACARQDSGMRRRLRLGIGGLENSTVLDPNRARAMQAHWWLPDSSNRPRASGPEDAS